MHSVESNRSRIDIIESILEYIENKGKAKKTHILYAANLNTRSLEKYLKQLINIHAIEIIEDESGKTKYLLTQYGKNILHLISKLRKTLEQKDPILDVRTIKILNNKGEYEENSEIESRVVDGLSGLTYTVFKTSLNSREYVVINIPDFIEINDIINDIAYTVLFLIDTKYSCIIYLKSINSKYKRSLIKDNLEKLFKNLNIDENRYIFIK